MPTPSPVVLDSMRRSTMLRSYARELFPVDPDRAISINVRRSSSMSGSRSEDVFGPEELRL